MLRGRNKGRETRGRQKSKDRSQKTEFFLIPSALFPHRWRQNERQRYRENNSERKAKERGGYWSSEVGENKI